jgi:hypothetical protein
MIFLHDANGIRTLYTILRDLYKLEPLLQMLSRPDCNSVEESLRTNAVQMAAFNDPNNIHGHKHRIMLCSTDDFGEGVSFMEVRHIIVGDTSSKQDVSVKQKKNHSTDVVTHRIEFSKPFGVFADHRDQKGMYDTHTHIVLETQEVYEVVPIFDFRKNSEHWMSSCSWPYTVKVISIHIHSIWKSICFWKNKFHICMRVSSSFGT